MVSKGFSICRSCSLAVLGLAPMAAGALSLAGLMAGAVPSASAATDINIQFDGNGSGEAYSGTAAAPDSGTFWNQAGAYSLYSTGTTTMADLTASDGLTTTAVGFTIAANVDRSGVGSTWGTGSYTAAQSGTSNVLVNNSMWMTNTVGSTGNPTAGQLDVANMEFTGLTPGGTYDLFVYGYKSAGGAYSTFTVGSTTVATDGVLVDAATPFDAADQGHGWNVIDGIVATNAGDISVELNAGPTSGYSFLNGLQLMSASPVPEPASLGLFAVGGLGLLLLKRRKTA